MEYVTLCYARQAVLAERAKDFHKFPLRLAQLAEVTKVDKDKLRSFIQHAAMSAPPEYTMDALDCIERILSSAKAGVFAGGSSSAEPTWVDDNEP